MNRFSAVSATLLLVVSAIAAGDVVSDAVDRVRRSPGAVYSMTNAAGANEVVAYARSSAGTLTPSGRYATGGSGSGGQITASIDALGSQGSLVLARDNRFLFAVNAGSDEISVFRVRPDHSLALTDTVPSGGSFPVSVTQASGLVYVLNVGGDGNVTGFRLSSSGRLAPAVGSTRSLNLGGANPPNHFITPAQIEFTPERDALVVTHKGTREIRVFPMDRFGLPALQAVSSPSLGLIPFGFTFDRRGNLLVSEDVTEAVSSYVVEDDGSLSTISASVQNSGVDVCWIVNFAGVYAYTTNTTSSNISGYRIDEDGRLSLLSPPGGIDYQLGLDAFPTDASIPEGLPLLYTLNAGTGTIAAFRIERHGGLTLLQEVGGLPVDDGAQGVAAF